MPAYLTPVQGQDWTRRGAKGSLGLVASWSCQNGELQVQQETLPQKIRWGLILETYDWCRSMSLALTCSHTSGCTLTRIHRTHLRKEKRAVLILCHSAKEPGLSEAMGVYVVELCPRALSSGACCDSGLQLLVPAALPACHSASCPGSPASTHPPTGHYGSVEAAQELKAGSIHHFRWADATGSRASTGTSPTEPEHRWQS